MAGHSKWSKVKHKKAVVDKRRGKLFAKLIRGVEVAARDAGTSDPSTDMTLASAFDRAKEADVPMDTIERAAKRGAGELDEVVNYERVVYEGYAPNGVAILVETLTENRNRTSQDVRSVFNKQNGSLGEPGSVAWMFERKGIFYVSPSATEDDVVLTAADAGAEDVERDPDGWRITCDVKDYGAVRTALKDVGLEVHSSELTMLPRSMVELDAEGVRPVLRLIDALDDLDDVQEVHSNFDVPEEVLAEVVG